MTISMEQIDELRRRTNCSYEEAKMLLEKHNGDLLEAIVEFERKNSSRSNGEYNNNNISLGTRIKRLINKGFKTRFIVEKSGETIINISINLLIIAAIILHWFLLIALFVSFILGCRFRIQKAEGENIDLSKMIDGFSSKVKEATGEKKGQYRYHDTSKSDNHNSDRNNGNKNDKNDKNDNDGYNEITIQ